MKIFKLNPNQPMSNTGSSLRSLIQNGKDPILDLYVRESIQNALDAGDESAVKFVRVDYITGTFEKKEFNAVFDEIEDDLNERFPDNRYPFLAIKDSNTTGLSGALKPSQIQDRKWGNLEKLVYQICRPQDESGAGGSWGIGKTIYFRMSKLGLVVYYSRTRDLNGELQSRLCAALVEDETSPDAIIHAVDDNNNKGGVAWWGEDAGTEIHNYPIIDDGEIERIVRLFGIEPFGREETGTIIIIPYIDPGKLLVHNKPECIDEEGQPVNSSWESDLEGYLSHAIQKWYAPRLDNPFYVRPPKTDDEKVFKYLKAYVNGKEISQETLAPIFKHIQWLYNESISKCFSCGIPPQPEIQGIKSTTIKYLRSNLNGCLGQLSYIKVDKSTLITDTDSYVLSYLGLSFDYSAGHETNNPILCMTRKPGMIVEYNSEMWMRRDLPTTNNNEFILAVFVLNTYAQIGDICTLEEYIRKKGGERADHLGWNDHALTDDGHNYHYVSTIIKSTADTLKSEYSVQEEKKETKSNDSMGALIAHLFKIKQKRKGNGTRRTSNDDDKKKTPGANWTIVQTHYVSDGILLELKFNASKKINKMGVYIKVDSDSLPFKPEQWEEEKILDFPFEVSQCTAKLNKVDKTSYSSDAIDLLVDNGGLYFFTSSLSRIGDSKVYGLSINTSDQQNHTFSGSMTLKITVSRKDLRPIVEFV